MLRKLQIEQSEWSRENKLKGDGSLMLLGVMEELGELSHAHLKSLQNIRTNENHEANKIDAIGDIVTYLAAYCNSENIDFQEAVEITWDKVKTRNWIKNPKNGEVELEVESSEFKIDETITENVPTPRTIDDAIQLLITNMRRDDLNSIASNPDVYIKNMVCTRIRRELSLWDLEKINPDLYNKFSSMGIVHADDISDILFEILKAKMLSKKANISNTLISIWQHWKSISKVEYLPSNIEGVKEEYIKLYNKKVKK